MIQNVLVNECCFVYLLFNGFQEHKFPIVALVKVQLDC